MVNNEVASVIVASAQSVAKVFVIGAVGFLAVRFPKRAPLLPASSVSVVARFTFHVLLLSLFYSTAAVSVSPDSIGQYWFVVVAAFVVLGVSYLVSTLLGKYVPGLRISNPQDFVALRVAATYPNIVALPILIFPSLCEYEVVYRNYTGSSSSSSSSSGGGGDAATSTNEDDESSFDPLQLSQQCTNDANTMIFCYFFTWSLLFWSLGYPQLLAAAKQRLSLSKENLDQPIVEQHAKEGVESVVDNKNYHSKEKKVLEDIEEGEADELSVMEEVTTTEGSSKTTERPSPSVLGRGDNADPPATNCSSEDAPSTPSLIQNIVHALRQTFTSPGFLALALGLITGCIPPLRDALFEPGGPLRFLGDAIETLGSASSSMSTMVVAASLVPPKNTHSGINDANGSNHGADAANENSRYAEERTDEQSQAIPAENPIMSDPNFGPNQPRQRRRRRNSLYRLGDSMRRSSANLIAHVKQVRSNPEQRRLLVWFTLSRLVLSPMIIVGILIGLNRGTTLLDSVPPLSQLVVIVNASLPGALVVVVLLKSQPSLSESASAVARVYLPTYLISIVTIAAWTAVGLWITMPDD